MFQGNMPLAVNLHRREDLFVCLCGGGTWDPWVGITLGQILIQYKEDVSEGIAIQMCKGCHMRKCAPSH